MRTTVVYSPFHMEHNNQDHFENKDRVEAIMERIKKEKLILLQADARIATKKELELVHVEEYIDFILNLKQCSLDEKEKLAEVGLIEYDNYFDDSTANSALCAVGASLVGIDSIFTDKTDNAFALCRPPGHHAETNCAMGFCFFNNAAIAARYAIEKYKVKKVFIFDFDVHHGNGTQHIFERYDNVFFCSIHQHPLYPGTGSGKETGIGNGHSLTLNLPLPTGSNEETYLGLMKGKVLPAIEKFSPDLIIVSAGFDAHKDDPLGDMNLDTESFGKITKLLKYAANKLCKDRLLYVLEGGYDLDALSESVVEVLKVLEAN